MESTTEAAGTIGDGKANHMSKTLTNTHEKSLFEHITYLIIFPLRRPWSCSFSGIRSLVILTLEAIEVGLLTALHHTTAP